MVVVYVKNGEKAPPPDANYVELEPASEGAELLLHCFFGDREVGLFKWDEVAGYASSVLAPADVSPATAYEAWNAQQDP